MGEQYEGQGRAKNIVEGIAAAGIICAVDVARGWIAGGSGSRAIMVILLIGVANIYLKDHTFPEVTIFAITALLSALSLFAVFGIS